MPGKKPMIAHIVAAARNGTIGTQGQLPWDIPEDMKFFREQTAGHVVIMGRKTYESIGKPLPKRFNIVISRQPNYRVDGASVVPSVAEALTLAGRKSADWGDEIYIIGGGEIYRQSMDLVDTIYLTRILKEVEGDAKYPEIDSEKFKEVARRPSQDSPIPLLFLTYKKN